MFKKSLKPKQKPTQIFTWHYFTAHGYRLEGFSGGLGRTRRLTLRDDFTARRDRLEGRVAVGTQRDPVTSLWTCWRALPRSPAAVCGPPRLHFYGYWQGDKRRGSNSTAQVHCCRSTAVCTFVCASDVRVVGSGVSDTLEGVRDRAGLSLRQFGGRGQRNVVVHESVPVKLYVHHLEERQLGVTETSRKKRSSIITYSLCSECLQPRVRSVQLWDKEKK